jgi:hypothetical protein
VQQWFFCLLSNAEHGVSIKERIIERSGKNKKLPQICFKADITVTPKGLENTTFPALEQ